MWKCEECGQEFPDLKAGAAHFDAHHVKTVTMDPLVLVIDLPDGCRPGRWEAARSFAESVAELRTRFPGKRFQIVPFSGRWVGDRMDPGTERFGFANTAVDAWLAIAEPEEKSRHPVTGERR